MTDELEHLKQALDVTQPEPDKAARRRAIGAAMDAFDQEFADARQGSAAPTRPSRQRASWFARLFGGRAMKLTYRRLNPVLLGGASLATIAVALIVAYDLPQKKPEPQQFGLADRENYEVPALSTEGFVGGSAGNRSDSQRAGEIAANERPAASDPARALAPQSLTEGNDGAYATHRGAGSLVAKDEDARLRSELSAAPEPSFEEREADRSSVAVGNAMPVPVEQKAQAEALQPSVAMKTAKQVDRLSQTKGDTVSAPTYQDQGRDRFAEIEANPVKVVTEEPVSTFSIDVDTASYSFVRRSLMQGILPQKDAVRVEEMVNYFSYDYPLPESRETPFRADVQIMPTPWNEGTQLMRIGIQGYELAEAEKPRANLVFLIDSSGSMNAPDKLPLLLNSFRLLIDSLDPDDTVAIVTYAGSAGTVLEPTKVAEAGKILAALERLHAGGSTAGAEGIRQAYRLAEQSFDAEGVNRVILATDGDFNVGITDLEELKGFVERKRKTGVFLSVLGFGQGNLNDELMQILAQNGNGQAAYIDTLNEARKALVEEAGSTLFPIAKDVKIQIEFNPAMVAEYRLIGYETRMLRREDFNNDKVDAGEIGSGHRVTALYEVTPVGSSARLVDQSRYQPVTEQEVNPNEYAFLKIRHKAPDSDTSELITTPITRAMVVEPGEDRARETRFAAAVAGFGQLLRGGRHMGDFSYDDVAALAQGAKGDDPYGYRTEFVNLVRLARSAAALEPLKQ